MGAEVSQREGPPTEEINIVGRGLFLSDNRSLKYYGLGNRAILSMACRSSVYGDADILSFVYGPDAPQLVATIHQVERDDGSVDVTATSIHGAVLVAVNTTPEAL